MHVVPYQDYCSVWSGSGDCDGGCGALQLWSEGRAVQALVEGGNTVRLNKACLFSDLLSFCRLLFDVSLFALFVGKGKCGMGVEILIGMQMGYYNVWMGHRIVGDDLFLSNYSIGCFLWLSG